MGKLKYLRRYKRFIKSVIQIIVIGLIFFFLGKTILENWHKVSTYQWSLNYIKLSISIFILLMAFFLLPVGSRLVLKLTGQDIDLKTAYRFYFYSQLPKYLPGKIWLFFARIYFYNKKGISKTITSVCLIIEMTMMVASGLLVFVASLFFWRDLTSLVNYRLLGFLFLVALILFLHPKIFFKLINYLLRILKRGQLPTMYSFKDILRPFLIYSSFWIVFGIGFYFFVSAVTSTALWQLPILGGAYALAWIIGFLSFITPGGIGVREGSLSVLLGFSLTSSIAVVISLLARLWWTAGELISVGIAYLLGVNKIPLLTSQFLNGRRDNDKNQNR